MTKNQEERKRPKINRGMELMLRNIKKIEEEPKFFSFIYAKMVSLFRRELHFRVEIHLKKRSS
ncbi:MAG: hypothetical protein RL264_188 [Bacteroidota bacterium]